MRLRKVVHRPNRYEEEYDSSTPQTVPTRLKNVHKSTIPAYPELLLSHAPSGNRQLRPAAFPSLPLKRKRSGSGQAHRDGGESRNSNTSRSEDLDTFHNRNTVSHQQEAPLEKGADSGNQQETILESDELLLQRADIPTSIKVSTSLPDGRMSSKTRWNDIGPGLQLYIFDSLLPQFLLPEFIGEVLGLDAIDLGRLVALKRQRTLQPWSTEQLWDYCRSIGAGPHTFIDPAIMQKYLDSFAFASQFETTTLGQRQTAVVFLRQRGIEAAFVEALLPDRPGIWTRPKYKKSAQLESEVQLGTSADADEAKWQSMLSSTTVHESHDLKTMAEYFTSNYFPADIRKTLLATSMRDLDQFKKWLMYGDVSPTIESTETINKAIARNSSKAAITSGPVPRSSGMSENQDEEGEIIESSNKQSHRIYCMLHKTTKRGRLLKSIIKNLRRSPLSRQRNDTICKIASRRVSVEPNEKLRTSPLASTGDGMDHQSSEVANSSNPQKKKGCHSRAAPGPVEEGSELPGETLDTSQNADTSSMPVASATFIRKSTESRDRASSEQSYHTAQDHESDAERNTTSQQYVGRSPSPPPWSPITEDGMDILNAYNVSVEVSAPATKKPDLERREVFTVERNTPWRSENDAILKSSVVPKIQKTTSVETSEVAFEGPSLELPVPNVDRLDGSTISRQIQVTSNLSPRPATKNNSSKDLPSTVVEEHARRDIHAIGPVSPLQSELLSGIHEAAIMTSPPSRSSNIDPLSLEASLDPNEEQPRQKLLPSASKKKTNTQADPPKPQKGRRKADPSTKTQAQSQEKTQKPALKVLVPTVSASSSTSTSPVKSRSRAPYKTRKDKGKKRGPQKKKARVSPTEATGTSSEAAKQSKAAK